MQVCDSTICTTCTCESRLDNLLVAAIDIIDKQQGLPRDQPVEPESGWNRMRMKFITLWLECMQ